MVTSPLIISLCYLTLIMYIFILFDIEFIRNNYKRACIIAARP